jgi:hypothetical protein
MSGRSTIPADPKHWFYDNRILVGGFCLLLVIAIFWQVSLFEGFQPVFTCARAQDVDRLLLSSGMRACMGTANSQAARERCMRTVYVLACMDERWR